MLQFFSDLLGGGGERGENLDIASICKSTITLQSFIVRRMTSRKITAFYVIYSTHLDQGLELAKQVLAASRIRQNMLYIAIFMAEFPYT